MSSPSLSSSHNLLKFEKNFFNSQLFEMEWTDAMFAPNCHHNFPACFTVHYKPIFLHQYATVKVLYDPSKGPVLVDGLHITFTHGMDETLKLIVKVEIVDNMDRGNQSILSVPAKLEIECKICLNPFSDTDESSIPRSLTACGHTICHKCAETLQEESFNRIFIRCPFDRTMTNAKAENLPRNFAILELIHEKNEEAKLAESMICEDPIIPCYENPRHESTKYCDTCNVDFCDSCFLSVHSSKILSTHKSVPVSERPIRLPKCPNHPTNIAYHFCNDKKCKASTSLCCDTCVEKLHKNHDVILIEQKAEEKRCELSELLETLNSTELKIGETLENTKQYIGNSSENYADYWAMIAAIEVHFEKKKEEAKQNFDKFMDSKMENMEKNKELMERDLKMIEQTKKEIEKILKKKDYLFAKRVIDQGKTVCSSDLIKEANLIPLSMPTLEDIIQPKPIMISTFSIKLSTSPPSTSPPPPPRTRPSLPPRSSHNRPFRF